MPGDKVWWTTDEAAKYLGISCKHLRDLAAAGHVTSTQHKPRARRRFRREWLDDYATARSAPRVLP